jgi:outer membrane protein OmpA-like peptidoglycan-associated protein
VPADDRTGDDDEAVDDPDRTAILARRQRFIALALGVVGAAACHRRGPEVCLSMAPERPHEPTDVVPTDAPPQPRLEVAPPAGEETPGRLAHPQACLMVLPVPTIQFATGFGDDALELNDDAKTTLDLAAEVLHAHPEIAIEVAGHTDDRGSPARNMKLSLARAELVRDYLITKGIVRERMTVRGYGSEHPRAPNDSDTNRAKNRRVELSILE